MYKKNKLGIYVYPANTFFIDNIHWRVNSIYHYFDITDKLVYARIINKKLYGIAFKYLT